MAGRLRSTGGGSARARAGGVRTGDPGSADARFASGRNARTAEPPAGDAGGGDPAEHAREICLRLLASRPRTRAELATALRRQRIADEVATEVLDRYGEVGIVDDLAFARAWVTSRHHGRGLARRALATELRRRGVDSHAVGLALAEIDDATEAQTARTLVERGLRGEPVVAPQVTLRRLVGMLARRGYSPGQAVRVVRQVLIENTATAEFAPDLDVDGPTIHEPDATEE